MPGQTIVRLPSNNTVLTAYKTNVEPVPVSTADVAGDGFILYVPVVIPSLMTVPNFGFVAGRVNDPKFSTPNNLSVWHGPIDNLTGVATPTAQSIVTTLESKTYYFPVGSSIPAGTVSAAAYINPIAAALSLPGALATVANNAARTTATNTPQKGRPSGTANGTANGTETPDSSPSAKTSSRVGASALAGGVVGAFLVGAALALIVGWLVLRPVRRSNREHTAVYSRSASSEDPSQCGVENVDSSGPSKTMGVTAWEKHLPQEKDDKTIQQAAKTVFQQVEIHVESYFRSKPGALLERSIKSLEEVSRDDVPQLLSNSKKAGPIFESILVRWIIHRISLRSTPEESLLPEVFTKIAESNNWHMETDGELQHGTKQGKSVQNKSSNS